MIVYLNWYTNLDLDGLPGFLNIKDLSTPPPVDSIIRIPLRQGYELNGLIWNEVVAEVVGHEYGLDFKIPGPVGDYTATVTLTLADVRFDKEGEH